MTGQLKGVLFDFDDTLIDWSGVDYNWREIETPYLTKVYEYIHNQVHPLTFKVDGLVNRYGELTQDAWAEGRTTLRAPIMPKVLVNALIELGVPDHKIDTESVIKAYDWAVVPGTVVFPDVPPMLEELIENDVKVGIVTNASQPMSMRDAELISHQLMPYFAHCRLSAADAGYLKPHPRIFEYALDVMGTKAEDTIFIGDNLVADVAGAQSAGMRAILRVTANAQPMISGLVVPDAAINSMAELPYILDEWFPDWRNNGK